MKGLLSFPFAFYLIWRADVFKINLAGRLRKKLTDRNIIIINKISGLMFVIFGAVLIVGVIWSSAKHKKFSMIRLLLIVYCSLQ